jgi:broad specificity phosphatase PhoE
VLRGWSPASAPASDFHGRPAALGDGTFLETYTTADHVRVIARPRGATIDPTLELDTGGLYPLVVAAGRRAVAAWVVPKGDAVRLVASARPHERRGSAPRLTARVHRNGLRFAAADAGKSNGMARYVELRRHTDNDGDALSEEGVRAALEIGRGLAGGYALLVSTGAQRATQTLACFACMLREQVPGGAVVEAGLRSRVEDRWRAAYKRSGSGDLGALRTADPELVDEDSSVLGAALGRVIERLPEGGTALAVGHSPTNEAAVLALTGSIFEPMPKGAGVLVVAEGDHAHAEPLPRAQRS